MKPFLLSLWLLSYPVFSSETFILPDHSTDAIYFMRRDIDGAKSEIRLITPHLQDRRLRDALQKAAFKGVSITIITQEESITDAAYLTQFKMVDVRIIKGLHSDHAEGRLRLSLLIIDDRSICTSSSSFDDESITRDIALIECTDDTQRRRHAMTIANTLYERSAPYLR